MSLIVDALKRAQEGTARRLPPLGGARGRSPLPGLQGGESMNPARMLKLAGGIVLVVVLGLGTWIGTRTYFRPRGARLIARPTLNMPETAPLLIVEAVPSAPAVATRPAAAAAGRGRPGTSAPAGADPGRPGTTARSVAPLRPPRLDADVAPVPIASAPSIAPPRTPAVVEVHVNEVRDAEDALAAGLSHQRRGDWASAIEEYRRGIASDAKNPGLFNNLGIALKQTGRLDEAASAFEDALNLDAKYEKALNNLGVTRYQQGRFEQAIDLFKQAIRINPANVESYVNLGIIYLPAGRWDEAFSVFQDALRYDPRSPEANYNLGLLWERRGDAERAKQHYERFVTVAGTQHQDLAARVKDHLKEFDKRR